MPTNASWLNRIEAQFAALGYFALDGTDHQSHEEQNSMIRRNIAWRNRHAKDEALQELTRREVRCNTISTSRTDPSGSCGSPVMMTPTGC